MQPKAKHSLRAQAQLMRTETVETFELVKVKQKLLDIREKGERERVNIIGLCCSEGSLSLGSGNEGKREIVLNRRPELHRGKYRCVQPKINLLKRRSHACETQCFPVEPSGCRRDAFT
ncbi:hypothetical protein TNCV_4858631 [Trichonephila clavipes]|nr:hypothetical protein TNCV_4858631 [Trichonephila clavipes]